MYQQEKIVFRDFPVIKEYGDEENFFRLQTETGEVRLQKLPFQLNQPLPDTLNCKVKGIEGNTIVLGHNMPRYVNEFYADGYAKGQEFEFKVVSKPRKDADFYRIEDKNGLQFKLIDSASPMSIGQSVKCKFDRLDPYMFILRRSNSDSQLRMVTFREIGHLLHLPKLTVTNLEEIARRLTYPNIIKALAEYDNGMPSWIFTAMNALSTVLPKWFSESVRDNQIEITSRVLTGCKSVLLYLLEGSDFLRNIKGIERTMLQQEITRHIELIDAYNEALIIIKGNKQKAFIQDLLEHLKASGYIFHPNAQFTKMNILFRIFPELVNYCLGSIFETLLGWYPDTWKAEPFRHAFLEQLQVYISETREEIENFLVPETVANNQQVERVLTAIAIQEILTDESSNDFMRYNLSLFYRCLSILRRAKADIVLHKALLTVMDVHLPIDFTWAEIKETTMMMTRASIDPPINACLPEMPVFYYNDDFGIEIEVGPNGIVLQNLDDDNEPQIINGMLPWPGLKIQVKTKLQRSFSRQKIKTLEGHAEFWTEIEKSLYQPVRNCEITQGVRRAPDIDDTVRIIIDRLIPDNNDPYKVVAMHCKIVDEQFIEGDGILEVDNLVSYNLHGVPIGTFRHKNGKPMKLDAQVVDIDENGVPYFSLLERCQDIVLDNVGTNDTCYAVITKDNAKQYSAISEKGFGIYIDRDEDSAAYRCGQVVLVNITAINNKSIRGEVLDGPIDGKSISNALALHNLLKMIAVQEPDDDATIISEPGDLEIDDVREIAQIMRYKALSCSENIINAFDYLSFARLLALAINDTSLAEALRAHKEILLQHQYYAKNKKIDNNTVAHIREIAPDSVLIARLASRLDIVAMLGNIQDNNQLWRITSDCNSMEAEIALAQMVLSHNLLYDINHEDAMLSVIKEKIAKVLNVDSEQRKLKYYGSESQYLEFKSSLVYPAQKRVKGISEADPDKQEKEIMHIIAGFLNTTGGTLYIGVHDDHYERGLEDDFKFYKIDTSDRNTHHRRQIKSLDNMANYLQNLIDKSFNLGINAGDYAKAFIDDDSTMGVIGVKIDPCPHVVTLDDIIYVRHSAKTSPLIENDEIEQFKLDRQRLYNQQKQAAEPEEATPAFEPAPTKQLVEPEDNADSDYMEVSGLQQTPVNELRTSKLRHNVLHSYDENYVEPAFYIRFVDDHEYIITQDEWTLDESDRLDLAITNDEADQWLVLIYENEQAVKVRLKELLEKQLHCRHSHFSDSKLLFACPMATGSGLYSLHTNSRGTVYERFTPIENIDNASISSTPNNLLETDCQTWLWEAIPPERASEFSEIKSTNLKRAQIGSLVKFSTNEKVNPANAIANLYKKFQ